LFHPQHNGFPFVPKMTASQSDGLLLQVILIKDLPSQRASAHTLSQRQPLKVQAIRGGTELPMRYQPAQK
jgi:hypothetical protein